MADSVATVMGEPSTAISDDVLAGMDHAEVHYFNRCVKVAVQKPPDTDCIYHSYNHHGTFQAARGFFKANY